MHQNLCMELSPNLQEIACQSDPDIREYRLLFEKYSISYGAPQNLSPFIQELKGNTNFAADFWQHTAFVQMKEKGNLSQCELLTLLVISVAGTNVSIEDGQMCELVTEFDTLILAHKNSPIAPRVPELQYPADAPQTSDRNGLQDRHAKKLRFPVAAAKFSPELRQYVYVAGFGILSLLAIASLRSITARHNHSEREGFSEVSYINGSIESTGLPAPSQSQASLSLPLSNAPEKNLDSQKHFSPARGIEQEPGRHSDHFALDGSVRSNSIRHSPLRRNISFASTSTPTGLNSSKGSKGKTHTIGISSGIMTGNLLQGSLPSYPKLASLTHVQGPVFLQTIISPHGTVESVHVIKGPYLLRKAATSAVRTWLYKPYVINGKATEVATIVKVNFALRH